MPASRSLYPHCAIRFDCVPFPAAARLSLFAKNKKIFSFIFVISIKHATILSSIATCPHFLFIVSEKEIENTFLHFPLDTFTILTSLKQKGYYSIAHFKSYNILYF